MAKAGMVDEFEKKVSFARLVYSMGDEHYAVSPLNVG